MAATATRSPPGCTAFLAGIEKLFRGLKTEASRNTMRTWAVPKIEQMDMEALTARKAGASKRTGAAAGRTKAKAAAPTKKATASKRTSATGGRKKAASSRTKAAAPTKTASATTGRKTVARTKTTRGRKIPPQPPAPTQTSIEENAH